MKTTLTFILLIGVAISIYSQNITNTFGTSGVFSIKDASNTFFYLRQNDGFIGIGTTSPTAKLTLSGSDALINGLTLGKGTNNISTNTAFGYHSLSSNTTGWHNLALGYNSLSANQSGAFNSAAGVYSLEDNTTGERNTAFGYSSLANNTTGGDNTALGSVTLVSNTSGNANTAIGDGCLWLNVGNSGSTAVGHHAMYYADNRTAGWMTYNTAVGYEALLGSTTASSNTGRYNTAIGSSSLSSNTTGNNNTANGSSSLFSNTSGYFNTATGMEALYSNTTGDYNTANGTRALFSNTGSRNTANGVSALYYNATGSYNTAAGMFALYANTTQAYNTAVGYSAGDNHTASESTFLGYQAYPNASGYTNLMGLGYNSRPTASNQVRIGNSLVTSIGGYAGWTNLSDARYKTAVQDNVKGLDFILKLRPITYKLDINKLAADLGEDRKRDENGNIIIESLPEDIKARNEKSQIVYTGFVAQEVEKAANEIGFDFSGIDAPKNENDFYGLRYAEFVVPLVKAVQEQQKIIEGLTKRIEELEKK